MTPYLTSFGGGISLFAHMIRQLKNHVQENNDPNHDKYGNVQNSQDIYPAPKI